MPAISKHTRGELYKAKFDMLDYTRRRRHFFPLRDFLALYWTPEELAAVETTRSLVESYQIDSRDKALPGEVKVEHAAYPQPEKVKVEFHISQPNVTPNVLWPKDLSDPLPYADKHVMAAFDVLAQEVADAALDRAVFDDVCTFVIDECRTHEAARYLFPPYLALLHRSMNWDVARMVEHIEKVPSLPTVNATMRRKIRHAIQWFAVQEMLGTFESPRREPQPETHLEVTLGGNFTCYREFEGQEYSIRHLS